MRCGSPKPASTRRRSRTCTRARSCANMFDALYEYEFLARPGAAAAEHRGGAARGVGRLQDLHDPRQARHLLQRRPGVQGRPARADRRGLRLLDQAPLRSALEEPDLHHAQQQPHHRPRRGAPGRAARQEAVRLRQAGRGPARARPLHAPVQARRAEPALHRPAERPGAHRRGGARGGRVLRRQDHGAPGRHRPVPAGRSGGAARGSRSRRTRTTATSSTRRRRRPTIRSPRPRPSGSPAASCR